MTNCCFTETLRVDKRSPLRAAVAAACSLFPSPAVDCWLGYSLLSLTFRAHTHKRSPGRLGHGPVARCNPAPKPSSAVPRLYSGSPGHPQGPRPPQFHVCPRCHYFPVPLLAARLFLSFLLVVLFPPLPFLPPPNHTWRFDHLLLLPPNPVYFIPILLAPFVSEQLGLDNLYFSFSLRARFLLNCFSILCRPCFVDAETQNARP